MAVQLIAQMFDNGHFLVAWIPTLLISANTQNIISPVIKHFLSFIIRVQSFPSEENKQK